MGAHQRVGWPEKGRESAHRLVATGRPHRLCKVGVISPILSHIRFICNFYFQIFLLQGSFTQIIYFGGIYSTLLRSIFGAGNGSDREGPFSVPGPNWNNLGPYGGGCIQPIRASPLSLSFPPPLRGGEEIFPL